MAAFDHVDPVFLAQSKLRRRKFDDAIEICTKLLADNPYDRVRAAAAARRPASGLSRHRPRPRPQAVWYIKTRALTLKNWIDDTEMEEEGIAEVLLDDNATANAPRYVGACPPAA